MTKAPDERFSVGQLLRRRRVKVGLSQSVVAERSGISAAYCSTIENGKSSTPSRDVLKRFIVALSMSEEEAVELEQQAACERGTVPQDYDLPEEAQALIADIRAFANAVPPAFLLAMKAKLREVVF